MAGVRELDRSRPRDPQGAVARDRSRPQRHSQHLENDPDSDIAAEISTLLGPATLTDATLGLLGMGRDVPDGRMRLRGNARLDIDWSKRSSRQYFARVRATMRHITDLLGGSYMEAPGYNWAERLMTCILWAAAPWAATHMKASSTPTDGSWVTQTST
jgi:hypothetical protein